MSATPEAECCPRFDPAPWDDKEITWEDKKFLKDRVRALFHIPLNFGGVMKRNMELIENAGAKSEEPLMVSDANSLWGADVYIDVTRDVPGAQMATLSGTFVSKVFEGPYKDISKWMKEMAAHVAAKQQNATRTLFYYTTCPRCAKKYGKNYVVLLAQVA